MLDPTVAEVASLLCRDNDRGLVFRGADLERFRDRALKTPDRTIFTMVTELLDFAAYLEVQQAAPMEGWRRFSSSYR